MEDPELLEGRGTFIGNLAVPGLLHVSFVRSHHAHALVTGIDVSGAHRLPGVVATFTHADLDLPAFHAFGMALNPACARPALADGKVRFVGEPIVAVVAETVAQAEDAAEAVVVDYEPLPAVVDPEAALAEGAPIQFDELGSNLAAGQGDRAGIDPLSDAAVVVRGRFVNQRIAVVPMEGNAISVIPAARNGEGPAGLSGPSGTAGHGDGVGDGDAAVPPELTVYVSTQMPHLFRRLATALLGLPEEAMRVITPHVGGGFGGKAGVTAEHLAVLGIARRLGRPVRWVETRSENMVALPHGRSQIQYIEMGFDGDGHITGMHARILGDAGAYGGFGGGLAMGPTRAMAQGVYRIPKIAYDVAVAVTNTTPVGAFRGAGRPEAAAFLERIMDLAADELDIDPVEIRRRNLLGPDVFPYTTLMGTTYDIGDYALPLERAVERAGYERLLAEQAERRARGDRWQLGIGVSTYVEITAGGASSEYGSVAVGEDGTVTVSAGTSAHGQGHATSFAMLVADRLHVPLVSIRYVQSDTDLVPRGGGTGGSRSLQIGGTAVYNAAGAVVERARRLAARLLEADRDDIVVGEDGRVGVAGVPARALSWAELAQAAARDDDGDGPLAAALDTTQDGATFPFGAHIAVVEVDLETGAVRHVRHVAVDDCGRIVNPLLVRGQQHGGIAQGAAQALWEQFVYDADGNPITSTLAEYAMPSAAELPSFETENTETPTPLNPLGAKGIGESGTIGSMPAVQNAVVDALSHLGVRHLEMPCTPERVWRAINEAAAGRGGTPWREPPAFFDALPERGSRPTPAAADVDI
ncbi:MAG TPA: xanthine dehydrogenase family protein molybdopterin-binding subunit [Acidimicrobiales bacterium]